MKINHPGLVTSLCFVWVALATYSLPLAAHAASLTDDVASFDLRAAGWAAVIGAMGGFAALIVALGSDKRHLTEIVPEALRNLMVSPVAGFVAYLVLEAAIPGVPVLNKIQRFLALGFAGWAGVAFFIWGTAIVQKGASIWAAAFGPKGKP